ncbi:hypothetical protein GFS24_12955 [Chitinophaga sp. SYP-B3965]|uniref:hypothetical protein n=1 Tax=Chitinophaga sp. SYP-B3965 TaxID=2663120 RepID=UPI0012999A1C|nr:hypothetical protein [Chitinophaga sp. SYP-B3965]MRG46030.1 hypothetical protein [Chitinophaga sp. SYP-B3965]
MPAKFPKLLFAATLLLNVTTLAQNKLDSTGNVGIGTLTPSEKLTIYNGNQLFRRQFGTGPDYDWLTIGSHEQTEKEITGIFTGIFGTNINPTLDGNGKPTSRNIQPTNAYRQSWALTFGSGETYNNFSIWTGHEATSNVPLTAVFNISSYGNIGMGLSNPQARLDVNGSVRYSGMLVNETDGENTTVRLKPLASNTASISGIFEAYEKGDIGNSGSALFGIANSTWAAPLPSVAIMSTQQGTGVTKDIMIWAHDNPSATNTALCIKANTNNVGIGTTAPGPYKLAVEGTIGARKVKVTGVLPWADFVFEPAYVLPTLAEIEAHIRSNKHLPGIPSAAEIKENGLDLGDMQQKQMQKIEELTLYLIEINKKLAAQDAIIAEQQKEIKELKKKK